MTNGAYQYYAGSVVYKNDKTLNYLLMEEGMVNKSSGGYVYEYHLKDHLGNVRVTFQPNGTATTLTQATEYYPFGMNYLQSPGGTNKYLYNGKEKQDDQLSGTYLDWYDYGARFYDPAIGRFTCIDPLSNKFTHLSPYNYASNNPVSKIDLWGLQGVDANYLYWLSKNPTNGFADGARQVFNSIASHLPNFSAGTTVTNKETISQKQIGNTTVSTSKQAQTKAFVIAAFNELFDYKGNNEVQSPLRIGITTTVKNVAESKSTIVVEGVPVNVNTKNENNPANGENTSSVTFSTGVSTANADANVYVTGSSTTTSEGQQSTSAAAGVKGNFTIMKEEKKTTQVGVYLEVSK